MRTLLLALIISSTLTACFSSRKNDNQKFTVTAYYPGDSSAIDAYDVNALTHIIFSFCHLKDGKLSVDNAKDSAAIRKLVSLKKKNPSLKVLLSLGGWEGCKDCSPAFSTDQGRKLFARSTKEINDYFNTDGIDLDWEYPAIQGPPGHPFMPADKENFSMLVRDLRDALGKNNEISFAAGGFTHFLQESIDWKYVMPLLDRVNLMTYDLIHGYSKETGHHTPLYSTPMQKESTDNAIRYLDSIGAPLDKMVIGAAFYARIFEGADSINNGLYRPAWFLSGVSFKDFDKTFTKANGWEYYWDDIAKAPYYYNRSKKQFATFDNEASIRAKTAYAVEKKLNGIMFWQLLGDKPNGGLVHTINTEVGRKK